MIDGFILGKGNGAGRVLVRAIGPSLAGAGVTNVLADPILELHNGDGTTIASNDNWKDSQQADITATDIAPTNNLESAILTTLTDGAYTAIVRGKRGGVGIGLVEAYNVP